MSDPGAPETAPDGFIPVASHNPFGALMGPPYENVEGDRFWVQGTSRVTRATASLVFAEAAITANGRPVMSETGIFQRIRTRA